VLGASRSPRRLLTLNISGPSTDRASRLLSYLRSVDPDVVVMTETRPNAGTEFILRSFRDAGYEVDAPMPSTSGERGVAVIHRLALLSRGVTEAVDLPHRLVAQHLPSPSGLTLFGAYVPSRDASSAKIVRKQTFLTQMGSVLQRIAKHQDVILMGDFNIIGRSHIPRYSSFRTWEYDALEAIGSFGLKDVFSELHPGVQAHSWIGRKGAGYRYDYAFVSEPLLHRVQACEYLHEPRDLGLTDHAGLLMTISIEGELLDVGHPVVPATEFSFA
jgi:exodeoxyribonuclease-3